MRFVPIKSVQQQSDLSLHRVRQGFVEERPATLNRIRGLIAEFGHVLPNGVEQLRRQVPQLIDRLPAQVAHCVHDLLEHAERLRGKVLEYEREISVSVRDNELVRRAYINRRPKQALPIEHNRSDRRSRNQINFRAEIAD
jgi:transposase